MAFQGFPDEALAFYAGLEADTTKAYFDAHRATFEVAVRAPMEALVDELEERYGPGRVMRPYRDVRFSRDKTPYRTALGAMVGDGFVQISSRGLGVGRGIYHLAPDQLARYRRAVDEESAGTELVGIVAAVAAAGCELLGEPGLATAPRGYPVDHARIDLLRRKGIVVWRLHEPAPWLGTAAARDRVIAALELATPLAAWLARNVGPSDEPAGRPTRRPRRA